MISNRRKTLLFTFSVWFFVVAAIHVLSALPDDGSLIFQILGSMTVIALIYPPVLIAFLRREVIPYWKLDAGVISGSLAYFCIVAAIIFPSAVVINHFYQRLIFNVSYVADSSFLWAPYILSQVVLVAFPEEFFFRGYLQSSLSKVFPPRATIFGAPFGRAQLITSLVFALSHSLITVQWWHAFIFFPALVFAWLKEKTGTIWAGTLFHAACNVFAYWVALHYGRVL